MNSHNSHKRDSSSQKEGTQKKSKYRHNISSNSMCTTNRYQNDEQEAYFRNYTHFWNERNYEKAYDNFCKAANVDLEKFIERYAFGDPFAVLVYALKNNLRLVVIKFILSDINTYYTEYLETLLRDTIDTDNLWMSLKKIIYAKSGVLIRE